MRSSFIHVYYSDKFCLFTFLLSSISVCTQLGSAKQEAAAAKRAEQGAEADLTADSLFNFGGL